MWLLARCKGLHIYSLNSFFIACIFDRKHRYIRSEARILLRNERRNWRLPLRWHVRRCTFRDAMRTRNRWTDGCKQTRRMSKLLSPMHPLFRFLCSSVLILTLHRCRPYALAGSHAHTFSLSPSLWFHLSGQARSPVSRLSSCDNPTSLCVNSCTHRQRIPTGEHTAGNVYLA